MTKTLEPLMIRRGRGGSNRLGIVALTALLAAITLACQTQPRVCQCDCSFKATTPQVGKGCWVEGDKLICPLVRRSLKLEPAYPSEDPRCEQQEDGRIKCAIHPGDVVE